MNADCVLASLNYDSETGEFTWSVSPNRRKPIGSPAGSLYNGRVHISVGGKRYFAHRLAWLITHGQWPQEEIDHINGDPADNRISNLREANRTFNSQNRRKVRSDSRSGVLGVHLETKSSRNPYVAKIVINGKQQVIGRFTDPGTAHAAYIAAKRIHHEGNTL